MKVIDKGTLITVLAVSAGLLGSCGRAYESVRVCTDGNGLRMPDANCAPGATYGGHGGWIYINRGEAPAVGERVTGGSYAPASGTRYGLAPEGGVSRGGFGGTGEGFGGGHGGFGE
ncbi:hypothetical protein [Asticcacaulis solisilvae]|uniref:hypothetical protein n=1 Tax=Asticcacaulis solisilvae TaxID=1217274 RepID=UPI003FD752E0